MASKCVVCNSEKKHVSVEKPVDYEYEVVPKRQFRYLRCNDCQSEWLDPRPNIEELISFYPGNYHAYSDESGFVVKILVNLRAKLHGHKYKKMLNGKKGSLFDVGAGDCRHFNELARYVDMEFSGIEIQPDMAEHGRKQGYDIVTGTVEEMDIEPHRDRHDIVSMNHVLEHVNAPQLVMGKIHLILKPGGSVIGQLPSNSGWESRLFGETWAGYHFPRHLQIFSNKGLKGMLEKLGYEDITVYSAPHCQTAISMQSKLLEKGAGFKLSHGRTKIYSTLLLASLPLEILATVFNKSGVINFSARKAL